MTAGRVPQGAVIARDMITNIQSDQAGFSYVLTSPDFKTAARVAQVLNGRFGAGTARANDAETIRVNLPPRYAGDPVNFLADAGDLSINADALAKVVVNERTGTVVMGGDITLAACAIAHGNLSITITTENKVIPPGPFTTGSPQIFDYNGALDFLISGFGGSLNGFFDVHEAQRPFLGVVLSDTDERRIAQMAQ